MGVLKKNQRVVVCLDEKELLWVSSRADDAGLTLSATIRMTLREAMLDEAAEQRALPAEQGRLDPA